MEEKKTFTRVEKTSQPQPLRKDPRGGTRITMWKTFVSFDVFRRICKETLKFKCLRHINAQNTNFVHFCFRAILHSKSIGVNIGTFLPIETGSLTRSKKLFSRFSIIPYPLKIVLSLKYGRKKTFTRVDKTSQPQPLWKDPHGGTRITIGKTIVSIDFFRRICKERSRLRILHI